MRLSMIRACAFATVAATALAACAGHSVIPSSQSAIAPQSAFAPATLGDDMSPLVLKTCAKSPPQFEWILKGACTGFTLKATGGTFSLQKYADLTVKGSIGHNTAKGDVHVVLADAVDKNGDILKYKGKSFPPYRARGTTILYAEAANQTSQTIKPIPHPKIPVIEYVITDGKSFPGKTCGAAVYGKQKDGKQGWTALTGTFPVSGHTVTIAVYEAPQGFELPPKGTPLYFGVNCF